MENLNTKHMGGEKMVDRKDQFYDLLAASIEAQAELIKNVPKKNIKLYRKLLNKHNKHLINNMSLLELVLNNASNALDITIKRLGE